MNMKKERLNSFDISLNDTSSTAVKVVNAILRGKRKHPKWRFSIQGATVIYRSMIQQKIASACVERIEIKVPVAATRKRGRTILQPQVSSDEEVAGIQTEIPPTIIVMSEQDWEEILSHAPLWYAELRKVFKVDPSLPPALRAIGLQLIKKAYTTPLQLTASQILEVLNEALKSHLREDDAATVIDFLRQVISSEKALRRAALLLDAFLLSYIQYGVSLYLTPLLEASNAYSLLRIDTVAEGKGRWPGRITVVWPEGHVSFTLV